MSVISYSRHHIAVEVRSVEGVPLWAAIGMYGWPETENKYRTWDLMRSLKETINLPTVFFGDFNEITSMAEKEGGVDRREYLMDAFRGAIDDCGLRDLGFKGSIFMWQHGSIPGSTIRERLDHFLADEEWCTLFPQFNVRHFPIYKSDHAPIFLTTSDSPDHRSKNRIFHFEALWLSNSECQSVVKKAWEDRPSMRVPTKIEHCAEKLRTWAWNTFGAVKRRIKKVEKELGEWKNGIPDAVMLEKFNTLVQELDELHRLEETYWHARARANEIRDGDKNTAYFYHKANSRRKRNNIARLKDAQGEWCSKEEDMLNIVSTYFTDLFASSNLTCLRRHWLESHLWFLEA